ncbi:MAG: cupin domain-containing protein [Planctomycetes bacterium]|nr:cupin domain-containing protein [Planctomycetota bacterium]
MTLHAFLDDDLRDEAVRFVLGSMDEDEARRHRLHLGDCRVCRDEVAALQSTAERLVLLAPAVPPPAGTFERILDRVRTSQAAPSPRRAEDDAVRGQVWKRWTDDGGVSSGFTYVDRDERAFEPTAFPGVRARRLFVDQANQRVTMLVRMDAGATFPPHRHSGPEDCYVLEGDLDTGHKVMHAGDYEHSLPASVHATQSTRGGCLLFIVSSLGDEIIA